MNFGSPKTSIKYIYLIEILAKNYVQNGKPKFGKKLLNKNSQIQKFDR